MQKPLSFLFFMLLAAALAGSTAAVVVSNSLERYAATLLDDRRFAAFAPSKSTQIPTTLDESLIEVQETVLNSLVLFVDEDAQMSTTSPVLTDADFVYGEGVVVSADGWIMTTREQLARYQNAREGYTGFVVIRGGETFTVERIVEDTQTNAVAVLVQNATGWTPVEFTESDEVLPGATVFGVGRLGEVFTASATRRGVFEAESIVPAEEPHALWIISETFDAGTPVLTAQNRLFGLATSNGYVLPAQALRPFIRQALRGSSITHAALGTYILDLAYPSSLSDELRQGYTSGALVIAKTGERTAIVKNSPADKAGLTDGDIILAIDDVRITSTVTCADILATYAPGQAVTLRVVRSGEVRDMELTLGTWEELLY